MKKIVIKNKLSIAIFFIILFQLMTGLIYADILENYQEIAENEHLVLFINHENSEVAVQDKDSGTIWYSNPPNRDEKETIARGSARNELNSQVLLSFYLPGNRRRHMNNYADSIVYNQFEIKEIENGVSIDYIIGEQWSDDDFVPTVIGKNNFETKILSNLEEDGRSFLLEQYHLLAIREKESGEDGIEIPRFNAEEVIGDYLFYLPEEELSERDQRLIIQDFLQYYVDNRSDIDGVAEIQAEDLAYLQEEGVYIQRRRIMPWDRDNILENIKKSGYTPDERILDYTSINIDPPDVNVRVFELSLEYIIDNKDLIVRVPMDKVIYPIDVIDRSQPDQEISLPIYSLHILPFFGAAGVDDEGYMFVPDGAGAIIDLNNEKTNLASYNRRLYGRDESLEAREEILRSGEELHLPVFGMKKNDKAFLAIIEEGDAYASIRASISGRNNSYNSVSSSFTTLPMAQFELGDGDDFEISRINIYQSRMPEGKIQLRYTFLEEENANYVGMAHSYQNYLIDNFQLSSLEAREHTPFILELLGAIDQQEPVFGIPRRVVTPMTSYSQVQDIIREFKENQVKNISLRMTGWSAGGERHFFPDKVRMERSLGSEEEFRILVDFLQEESIDFYPDHSFLNIYRNRLFDSYNRRSHAARFLTRGIAYIPDYNVATYQDEELRRNEKEILSARHLDGFLFGYMQDYSNYDLDSISFRYMGRQLNADFRPNPNRTIDRQQSLITTQGVFEELNRSQGFNIAVEGGNGYLLPYVNKIVRVPLFSTGSRLIDRGVPFIPIVLNGYIDFAGDPLNMSQNHFSLLKSIEVGAIPYYRGSYEDSFAIKGTDFDHDYALNYRQWFEEAVEFYHLVDELLRDTYSERIVDHQRLEENVFKTVYSNGVAVIVNYNNYTVNIDGLEVKGENFRVIQGEFE
ncbi:DUF5696 domain-containing protein [Natronospora cellulosivora (SeqCode)]